VRATTRLGGPLDRLVLPAFVGMLGEAYGFKMKCVGVRLGKLALFMVTPLHRSSRCGR
jgi:hypothetical protein